MPSFFGNNFGFLLPPAALIMIFLESANSYLLLYIFIFYFILIAILVVHT